MQCPRLDHFVRFNPAGTVSRCGHMQSAPEFQTVEQMETSVWLHDIKKLMQFDQWPPECVRCQEVEAQGHTSIRQHAIELDTSTKLDNYLQIGGVLDNVCNSACMTCNKNHSSMIAGLVHKQQTESGITDMQLKRVDNSHAFWQLPQHRIAHLDINGGEPSYSKNYRHILNNLPPNLETLRVNTNCNTVLTELQDIVAMGVKVTVTVSCDGIGPVHDLVRWPIQWDNFFQNLMIYKSMPVALNLWTTVSVLNHHDLSNIQAFAQEHDIDHSWAYLKEPPELSVDYHDPESAQAYIRKEKHLRGIE
jgi:sulfatase maturation enzyme AslB (radical SAM superfamily)